MKDISNTELKNKATEMRMKVVDMIYKAQSGHPGGSLSAAEFVTACYFKYMNVDPKNPNWEATEWYCPKVTFALSSMLASEHSVTSLRKFSTHSVRKDRRSRVTHQ